MRDFRPKALSTVALLLVMMALHSSEVWCWGLKTQIQDEIDSNPFLQKEGIKLRVTDEKNGYLTIEMYEGNRSIREQIRKGLDIGAIEQQAFWVGANETQRRGLNALKTVLNYLKNIDGVKAVMLSSATNTPRDKADELVNDGIKCFKDKKYLEAVNLCTRAIEIKSDYAPPYKVRGNAYSCNMQYDKAVVDYLKCAELEPDVGYCYNALSWLYATCKDSKVRDGKKAVSYGLKAISIAPDNYQITDTLAAAYARNGQFDKAVEVQQKSIDLLRASSDYTKDKKKSYLESANKKLNLYKGQQPYTQD